MKKYLKMQAKKSMSLFLAVLMLLSCWVWVAPEAKAINSPDEGYYYVEVRCKLTDWASTDETAKNEWTVTHSKGTTVLDAGPATAYNSGNNDTTGNYVIASGWVPAFPTALRHVSERAKDSCDKVKGDGFRVEEPTIWVGPSDTDKSKLECICVSDMVYTATENDYTINGWKDNIAPTAKEFRPVSGTVETWTVNVPQLGDNTEPSKEFSAAGIYDQYNVKMDGEVTYFVGDATGSTTYGKDGEGIWNSGTTVTFNANVQKNLTDGKAYLIASQGQSKGIIANIVFNFPEYTITVDPVFSDAVIDMSDGNTQTGTWINTGKYNTSASKYPTGTATKAGYTFLGFWTTPQPTEGDASYNATDASFAQPVSSTEFATYCTNVKDTDGDKFVTVEGKKYYNAGRQWDPTKDKTILGPDNFHGWWISQDITVKFYDIDGSYLGTKTTKYGKKEAENWYPDPKDSYNAGAYDYKTFAKKWRDITGAVITEGSYTFGALEELSLTPIYTNKTYSEKYLVNFVNPADGNNIQGNSKEYQYRYILNGTDFPKVDVPSVLVNDAGYSYEFSGWTSQAPVSGNYHKVAKNDTAITENTDWVVREEIKYYAIFRSTVKEYLVNFNYTDSTGAAKTESLVVPYGSAISTPDVVNKTYATGGYGYTLEGWDYKTNTGTTVMLGADETLVFNKDNIFVTTGNLAPDGEPIVFKANYDEGEPMPYTVTFKYKDAEGNDKVITDQVYHGYNITDETVEKLDIPAEYDDGSALYNFSNLWKVTEGSADKAEYTKDEFTSFSPTSHVTFEALYGEGVPFYTVKYIDGAKTYEERVLAGNNVPAWIVGEGEDADEYVPSKADTETGKYNFEGWFDEEQSDKEFAATNGTEYTTTDTVNSDLTLYSQFTYSPFKFDIVFKNDDGTVLAQGKYEAGDDFKAIYDEAEEKAVKPADKTYHYTFVGWDYKVPDSFLCEGKNMTYTAQYRPAYIYYAARWYNDLESMNDAVTELEVVGQDGLLAKTSYTYEGAVYAPSVELTAPDGMVFDGWKYLKDGVETDYVRGMTITGNMSFYATYKVAPKSYTVTAVVGDEETEYKIAEGDNAAVLGRPLDGYKDDTHHNKFDGWFTEADVEFDLDTTITEDITLTAKFTAEEHKYDQKELVKAPTYYQEGIEYKWCACSKDDTIDKDGNDKPDEYAIPVLTDTKAPTGTIYLGTQGKWSSTDAVGAAATDGDPVAFYANADTDIILTINDTGDVNTAYNPSGVGKGIKNIQGIISTGVFGADTTEIAGIKTIFTDNSETLNNTANYVIRLGEYEGLQDGETYIAYYYVADKADNVLNKNVRTAKFVYDATAPDFTIDGDYNEDAATATSATYCGKAVIKDIENGATLTINGEEVVLTSSGAAGTSNHTIREAGNYVITVTDKAGNSTTKKIKVTDGHDEVTTTKAVTCTEDGYEKVICAVCGKVIKNETIESEGHKYSAEITVAPTCTDKGYDVKTCSVCGDEVITNEVPAAGHKHNKDAEGNIIYTVLTAATCSTEGKKISNCTVCGKDTKTETIPVDTENGHKYGATKVLKATCTDDGEKYQNCKYCFEKKTVETLDKLNHVDTGRYTKVTTAPTCYSEGVETTYCKACDTVMGTAPVAMIAHTLVLVKYEGEKNDDVANYPYGYMQYECQVDGCGHTEGKTAITVKAEYTVTFKGAGAEGADVVITKTEGETIAADAVADQTKDQDDEYEYTFAGWKAASTGKIVKLPVKVTKNETYTAEFTATKRVYKHIFKLNKDDVDAFATIIGTFNAENKKPATEPTKAATATETFKFAGWKTTNGVAVTDFTMKGDETFVADFTSEAIKFNVVYLNEGEWFASTSVNGGTSHTVIADVPAKVFDKDNHYTFAGWNDGTNTYAADAVISNITANIRLTAKYTPVEHTYTVVNDATKTWAATCTAEGQKTEVCACGYEKVTTLPVIEHNYELQEDGSKKCSMCGDVIAPDAKEVTITFSEKVGEETSVLKSYKVEEGKEKKYTAPEKAADAQYEYKFVNWTDAQGNVIGTDAEITVTAGTEDATYYANYTATSRTYEVVYIESITTGKVLQRTQNIEYGADVPAYTGATPVKDRDDFKHYTFDKWELANGSALSEDGKIIGDTAYVAVFTGEEHDLKATTSKEPTCYQPGKTTLVCEVCGYSYDKNTGEPATGNHVWYEADRKEATDSEDGYIKYKCETLDCPAEKTEKLAKLTTTITVKVVDNANAVINGAVVVVDGVENGTAQTVNGTASFTVANTSDIEYSFTVEYKGETKTGAVKAGESATVKFESVNQSQDDTNKCGCSCHRTNFWGILFRLFHKFLKLFTGKINCCSCPDPLY